MNANQLIERFTELITHQAQVAKNLAKANMLNRAVLAERLCLRMASIFFDRPFESVNRRRANQDTIDLVAPATIATASMPAAPAICAQVTIRDDREKIDKTIANFIGKGHYARYDSLYFFIIGNKPGYEKPFETKGLFTFDPAIHVIAIPDMIRIAQALPIDQLHALVETVEAEIFYERSIGHTLKRHRLLLGTCLIAAVAAAGLMYAVGAGRVRGVPIPGNTGIEQAINRAKMEGAPLGEASSETVSAIPFALPVLTPAAQASGVEGNVVGLSNSSPLHPENQDIVFGAGRCRFLGRATWPSAPLANASISVVSCVELNGDAYGYGTFDGPEIGFVTTIEHPANRDLPVDRSDRSPTLDRDAHYLVRFVPPIHALTLKGKSAQVW